MGVLWLFCSLAAPLASLGCLLASPGVSLGASWAYLGPVLADLGRVLGLSWLSRACLGPVLALSWASLGTTWSLLCRVLRLLMQQKLGHKNVHLIVFVHTFWLLTPL